MADIYLVTGATGHLGFNLVHLLIQQNKQVRVLVLPNDRHRDKLPHGVKVYTGDVLDIDSLDVFFTNPNLDHLFIIHCAGIVTTYSKFDARAYAVNVHGTKNIVNMCIKHHAKKLVYISSVHALVELAHGQTIQENASFHPDLIVGFYGKTKAEASQIVVDAVKQHDLDASLIFPSGIIGPHDYYLGHTSQMIISAANQKMNIWIKGGFDFVDVRDVAQGIVACCEYGEKGEGYLLSNVYTSFRDLMHCIDIAAHHHPVRVFIPKFLIQLSIPFMYAYYKLLKRRPLLTTYSLYTILSNSQLSNQKAQAKLHYTTRPFQQTIQDTVDWLDSIGKINKKNNKVMTVKDK